MRFTPTRAIQLTASVYDIANRNDILFQSASVGATTFGYFANVDRTRFRGADLAARARAGRFTARFAYSYLNAVYDTSTLVFSGGSAIQTRPGMRIAGLPRHTVKLGGDWRGESGIGVGAELVAVSALASLGNEDGRVGGEPRDWRVPGYAIVNLRASYRVERGWEFFGRIANVFDRRYATWGATGQDLFPGGRLADPRVQAADSGTALFVAPGAPRTVFVGVRARY